MTSAFHPNGPFPAALMRKMRVASPQKHQATQSGALLRNARRSAPAQAGSYAASRRQIGSVVFGKQEESERMTEWNSTFRVGIYVCEMTYRPRRDLKVRAAVHAAAAVRSGMGRISRWQRLATRRSRDRDRRRRHGRRSMNATVVQALDGKWAVVRPGEPIPETGRYATTAADTTRAATSGVRHDPPYPQKRRVLRRPDFGGRGPRQGCTAPDLQPGRSVYSVDKLGILHTSCGETPNLSGPADL
jgi:hypothetical protein